MQIQSPPMQMLNQGKLYNILNRPFSVIYLLFDYDILMLYMTSKYHARTVYLYAKSLTSINKSGYFN